MKNISCIKQLFFAYFLCITLPVFACKPGGLQQHIEFEEGSSAVGATKARDLALWFLDWRDGRGISYVMVFSNSKENDKYTKNLSNERLKNISSLIGPLAGDRVSIKYMNSPINQNSKRISHYFLNTIEISVQPKCTETGTCCL
ncbi:hypothetical protein [Delftia sp. PS-11]|uniref:hypothetical protein n=1 Tax=Delftia sp. PS-11 TaxID=2767222 RepID=UPI002453F314|nr:hypothetical protein [Delftia sp. PS-11]KAJ8745020.1 hypothetical protein H9T68_09705 [Delftia sp. PS-11]